MALLHMLPSECQEENDAEPEETDVLTEQAFQRLCPKERCCERLFSILLNRITHAYNGTHPHGGGMLCSQAGGRRSLYFISKSVLNTRPSPPPSSVFYFLNSRQKFQHVIPHNCRQHSTTYLQRRLPTNLLRPLQQRSQYRH